MSKIANIVAPEVKPDIPAAPVPCPCCGGGMLKGVGTERNRHPVQGGVKIYFKCNGCGHDWTRIDKSGDGQVISQTVQRETRPDGRNFLG